MQLVVELVEVEQLDEGSEYPSAGVDWDEFEDALPLPLELAAQDMPAKAPTIINPRKIPLIDLRDPLYALIFMANSSPNLGEFEKCMHFRKHLPSIYGRLILLTVPATGCSYQTSLDKNIAGLQKIAACNRKANRLALAVTHPLGDGNSRSQG